MQDDAVGEAAGGPDGEASIKETAVCVPAEKTHLHLPAVLRRRVRNRHTSYIIV